MKETIFIFCVLTLLLLGSGCTESINRNSPVDEGPAVILRYESGNLSIPPIDTSQIEVIDPDNSTANVTPIVAILLDDQRTGILLENGWKITTASKKTDEHDPNLAYVDVEFEKEGLSFFIKVDETANRTLEGHSGGAKLWVTDRISGPRPEDYHQWKRFDENSSMIYTIFDHKTDRTVMIYNKTMIFYLYPSYATIDIEGLND